MLRTRLFHGALLLAASASLSAQSFPDIIASPGTIETIEWDHPPSMVSSHLRSLVAGDFNNDGIRDLGFIREPSNSVEIQFAPQILPLFHPTTITNGARDIVVLPGKKATAPGTGEPDRLVVHDGQLHIGTYGEPGGIPTIQWTTLTTPAHWDTVDRLRILEYAPGQSLLVGIRANDTVAYTGRIDANSLQDLTAIQVNGSDLLDVQPLNFVGNATPELAILTVDGLRIHSITNTLLGSFPSAITTNRGEIARLDSTTSSLADVGWLTPSATGSSWEARVVSATTYGSTGLSFSGAVPLNFVLTGISAADINADGADDLVATLGGAAADEALLLERLINQPTFSTGATATLPGGATQPVTSALVADFDPDGFADLVTARVVHGKVVTVFAARVDSAFALATESSPIDLNAGRLVNPSHIDWDIELDSDLAGLATHLSFVVFRSTVASQSSNPEFEDAPVCSVIASLANLSNPEHARVSLEIPDIDPFNFTHHYFVIVTALDQASQENATVTYGPELWGFTSGHPEPQVNAENYFFNRPEITEGGRFVDLTGGPGRTVGSIKIRKIKLPPVQLPQSLIAPQTFFVHATDW